MPTLIERPDLTNAAIDRPRVQETVKTGVKMNLNPESRRPDKVEAPVQEATKLQEDPMSSRFAALAKQQKGLAAQQQKLKADREALEKERDQYKTSYVDKKYISDKLASDPLSFFKEHGVGIDQVTQAILNQPSPQDQLIREQAERIKALEDKTTKVSSEFEARDKQAYETALNVIRDDVKDLVSTTKDFDVIKAMGAEEAVVALIDEHFTKTGQQLDIRRAAQEVEDYLVKREVEIARLEKIQSRLAPVQEPQIATTKEATIPKTLTHAQTALSTPSTAKDRKQRAILAFEGKL